MKEFFELRICRMHLFLGSRTPFIRLAWSRVPNHMKSFGWVWIFVKGVGNYTRDRGWSKNLHG